MIKDEYATKDLYLASFFRTQGVPVSKLERRAGDMSNSDPVYFIFEDKKRCEELENIFWNGIGDGILVNAKKYVGAIRDLKSRIFSINRLVGEKRREIGR